MKHSPDCRMARGKPNLIQIQEKFMATINAAHAKWQHRKGFEWQKDKIGGHYERTYRKAQRMAHASLTRWGFSIEQRAEIIRQAHEMAILERLAD